MIFLIDIVMVVVAFGLFWILNITGILPIVFAIGSAVAIHLAISKFLSKKDEQKELEEYNKNKLKRRFQEMREKYRENDDEEFIDKFEEIVEQFYNIKEALYKLLALNDDNQGDFIRKLSEDTEEYIVSLMKEMEEIFIVLSAVSNFETREEEYESAETIIKLATETLRNYAGILVQVRKNEGKIERNDPGLKAAAEALESVRKNNTIQPSKGLFVETASSGSADDDDIFSL